MASYFVTGTDTGVGKTHISCALIRGLAQHGKRVCGMKPVASGCLDEGLGYRNADALALMQAASIEVPYSTVNRYAFAPPIAPHIAAEQAGIRIDIDAIYKDFKTMQTMADHVVVEGVGGWLVPLTDGHTMQDLAQCLQLPVVLVVAIRLGCLNHALLAAQAIQHSGLPIAGWVANHVDNKPTLAVDHQIKALKHYLNMPFFGETPYTTGSKNIMLPSNRKPSFTPDGASMCSLKPIYPPLHPIDLKQRNPV